MNLMFYLNLLDKKISFLTNFQKAQLYLIPILVSFFIIYNYIDLPNKEKNDTQEILEKNEVNLYYFLKDLQEFTNKNNLNIIKTQQNQDSLNLEIKGEFSDIIKVLYFCETFQSVNRIKNLEININKELTYVNFRIEFTKYKYNFTKVDLNFLEQKTKEKIEEVNQNTIKKRVVITKEINWKLSAIVNDTALLNNVWIKENDTIAKHKREQIRLHINKGKL